jgi:hypothetical protein
MRYIKGEKESGTYVSLEILDDENHIDNFAKRIGNWVKFIHDNSKEGKIYESDFSGSKSKTGENDENQSILDIIEKMIVFDETIMKSVNISDIREKILKASYDNDLQKEYRDIKRLLRKFKLKSIVEYNQLATQKMILPTDPRTHFGTIFKGWIDYLSINTSKYDNYTEFKQKCHHIMNELNIQYTDYCLNLNELCEKIYNYDKTLIHNELWYETYSTQGMNNIEDIFIDYINKKELNSKFCELELII